MLTRCPACQTHFRVTAEQLKARAGRVRCGKCQQVFNALDALIEEPMTVLASRSSRSPRQTTTAPLTGPAPGMADHLPGDTHRVAGVPAPTCETIAEVPAERFSPEPEKPAIPQPEAVGELDAFDSATAPAASGQAQAAHPEAAHPEAPNPEAGRPAADYSEAARQEAAKPATALPPAAAAEGATAEAMRPEAAEADTATPGAIEQSGADGPFVERRPRRWPWALGGLVALLALGLQLLLAFRVELAVLWPEAKPALIALCDVAGCEVGLPAKAALVGIEASDLHPDSEHPGRLALTATLKSRAPFAQQFPYLELTLTDTADKAIARKTLAPADYLPPKTALADGMRPNADVMVSVGIDTGALAASGYRLYVFYP